MAAVSRPLYPYGSAVPEYEPRKIREANEEYIRKADARKERIVNEKKAASRGLTIAQAVAVISCFAVVLAFSFGYMFSISELRETRNTVASYQKQYQVLVKENRLLENKIDKAIDYNAVYEYATGTLGMQTPVKEQIIYYCDHADEYVIVEGIIPHE